MGRQSVSSFDDVFSTKFRSVIQRVLDTINCDGELEHVEALYTSTALAAFAQQNRTQATNASWPTHAPPIRPQYTFEHFCQHLDTNDTVFHNLLELLVTMTARKAIAKAAQAKEELANASSQALHDSSAIDHPMPAPSTASSSSSSLPASAPNTSLATLRLDVRQSRSAARVSRESERAMLRDRALKDEIRGIVRRNRNRLTTRSGAGVGQRGADSDSSSDIRTPPGSPPPTRTVFSSLTDPAGYPTLAQVMSNASPVGGGNTAVPAAAAAAAAAATTRVHRVGQGSESTRTLNRDLAAIRRRVFRSRHEVAGLRNSINAAEGRQPQASTSRLSGSGNDDGFHVAISDDTASTSAWNAQRARYPYDGAVRQFLSQPFPSDPRRGRLSMSSRPASQQPRANAPDMISSVAEQRDGRGLDSTLAPSLDVLLRSHNSDLYTHPAVSLDPPESVEIAVHGGSRQGTSGSGTFSSASAADAAHARMDAVQAALHRLSSSTSGNDYESTNNFDNGTNALSQTTNRTGEFEEFAASRRRSHRARGQSSDDESTEGRRERETFEHAIASLSRADAALAQVLQGAERSSEDVGVSDIGLSGDQDSPLQGDEAPMDPLSERLLPPPSTNRPHVRIPIRRRLSRSQASTVPAPPQSHETQSQ